MLFLGPARVPEVACNSFFDSGAQRSGKFWGFGPDYLVKSQKMGQITWFSRKRGQITWICKAVGADYLGFLFCLGSEYLVSRIGGAEYLVSRI